MMIDSRKEMKESYFGLSNIFFPSFSQRNNMKKHNLTLLALLFYITLGAQEIWLETGLKGGGGTSFLLNKNILDDNSYRYLVTPTYGGGAKISLNFGPFHGLALEGMYNQSGQNFEFDTGVAKDLRNEISWKSIDAYLMYRYIRNRAYVEIGPMYSFVRSVEQTFGDIEVSNPGQYYEKNYLAGALGFGGYLAGSNTFTLGLGIRLHYGFTNFVSDAGTDLGFPNPGESLAYDSIEPTHPVFAQVLLEFNFGIGHWARTSCSKRMKFYGSGRK